jgi:hypothetical protein
MLQMAPVTIFTRVVYGSRAKFKHEGLNERSILDYIISSKTLYHGIHKIKIYEDGQYKVKGKVPSDNNSILVEIKIPMKLNNIIKEKKWKINTANWQLYGETLESTLGKKWQNFHNNHDLQTKYDLYINAVLETAKSVIGEKSVPTQYINKTLKIARNERRMCKILYETALKNKDRNNSKVELDKYIKSQQKVRRILEEITSRFIETQVKKLVTEEGLDINNLWKLRRSIARNS